MDFSDAPGTGAPAPKLQDRARANLDRREGALGKYRQRLVSDKEGLKAFRRVEKDALEQVEQQHNTETATLQAMQSSGTAARLDVFRQKGKVQDLEEEIRKTRKSLSEIDEALGDIRKKIENIDQRSLVEIRGERCAIDHMETAYPSCSMISGYSDGGAGFDQIWVSPAGWSAKSQKAPDHIYVVEAKGGGGTVNRKPVYAWETGCSGAALQNGCVQMDPDWVHVNATQLVQSSADTPDVQAAAGCILRVLEKGAAKPKLHGLVLQENDIGAGRTPTPSEYAPQTRTTAAAATTSAAPAKGGAPNPAPMATASAGGGTGTTLPCQVQVRPPRRDKVLERHLDYAAKRRAALKAAEAALPKKGEQASKKRQKIQSGLTELDGEVQAAKVVPTRADTKVSEDYFARRQDAARKQAGYFADKAASGKEDKNAPVNNRFLDGSPYVKKREVVESYKAIKTASKKLKTVSEEPKGNQKSRDNAKGGNPQRAPRGVREAKRELQEAKEDYVRAYTKALGEDSRGQTYRMISGLGPTAAGLDQVWVCPASWKAGDEKPPNEILVVECKGGQATLNKVPVYHGYPGRDGKPMEGGCTQLSEDWVHLHGLQMASTAENAPELEEIGGYIQRALQTKPAPSPPPPHVSWALYQNGSARKVGTFNPPPKTTPPSQGTKRPREATTTNNTDNGGDQRDPKSARTGGPAGGGSPGQPKIKGQSTPKARL